LILCSYRLSLDTRRATSAFPKARGTEIRMRGSRLSGYRSLRRNTEIRACVRGERIRSRARFPHPPTSVDVRVVPHGYVLVCLLPAEGCFRSRANSFFPVIAICRLIRSAVLLLFCILRMDVLANRCKILFLIYIYFLNINSLFSKDGNFLMLLVS